MSKSVMMMMAQLTTATGQEDVTADKSRCIFLLDFKKTYNPVDRDFMYEANSSDASTPVRHHALTGMAASSRLSSERFDIPIWAEKELHNLFKQFLWAHATSTDVRHTVNPRQLVTPRHARGIGLVDVTVAVKTQRTKHALIWLTQRSDKYFAAWRSWAFRGLKRVHAWQVNPAMLKQHAATRLRNIPGMELQRTIENWLAPTPDQLHQLTKWVATHSAGLLDWAVSWWDGDEFIISYSAKFPDRSMGTGDMPAEIRSFWATFNWSDDPWIRDQSGNMSGRDIGSHRGYSICITHGDSQTLHVVSNRAVGRVCQQMSRPSVTTTTTLQLLRMWSASFNKHDVVNATRLTCTRGLTKLRPS
uniref:RxLR effector candidate protein n=1 Tax=Hyaloperonospora arabidopsidis (strain Emoy2) TaxID=559515 RepID=M4B8A9_HYAAE